MLNTIQSFFVSTPWAQSVGGMLLLFAGAALANLLMRRLVLRVFGKLLALTELGQDQDLRKHNFVARLAHAVPAAVVMYGIEAVPSLPSSIIKVVQNVATAYIILTLVLAASTVLDAINAVYTRKGLAAVRPIKGYLQVIKIAGFVVAGVLTIAALVDRSPVILLSGLGAMAAVLILVFQDTLLSFVASVQISSSQMIRVGDWVQVPKLDVDGTVIDIALYHITVRNWDMTLTTIPVRKFIGEPFKNWRGMFETGSRRIKRSIFLDQTSVKFVDSTWLRKSKSDPIIGKFLSSLDQVPATSTNSALFREYLEWHLRADPNVDDTMRLMIRTTDPTPTGIPLEIYCFSRETEGLPYEKLQSGIFDHALAVLPRFGLSVFQAR
ncbi:mechanosensitive ion channel family protein [Pararhizobium sp. BT-229]|uniref:mechanosensitive ion channel family protein n=1 Tax=Pararhizobium sp. BT-229 TaxID=2986923 RepID=UPI0021F757DB|nr:mechanosensitive ion channel family protein [Pararhizobium sp. BT-229]MCV9964403.1 mechanosensitive ion channel family protein [Pararhizobium sp. BT-229]